MDIPSEFAGDIHQVFSRKLERSLIMKLETVKLQIHGLPVLKNLDDLSTLTRISKKTLYKCSFKSDYQYREVSIPKKNGENRNLSIPSRTLKALQAWILRNILDKLHSSSSSIGFERGHSIRENALEHIGANAMLNLDFADFYDHIKSVHVFNLFRKVGYNNLISTILSNICTYKGRLPQGSPCSPKIANLYCIRLDKRIQNYVGPKGLKYTRYADDITISGSDDRAVARILNLVKSIISDEKLKVNEDKTRISGFGSQKTVTGLVVTESDVGIGTVKYKVLRSKFHHLATKPTNQVNDAEINHCRGWLAYLYDVDRKRHIKFVKYISKLKDKYPHSIIASEF